MAELAAYLTQPVPEGYPVDFMLARLTARRAEFKRGLLSPSGQEGKGVVERPPPAVTALEARQWLEQEVAWIYRRMERDLRSHFAPLFLWFELRTVLVSLRLRRSGRPVLLEGSLLAPRLQRVLKGEEEAFSGKDALSQFLEADRKTLRELRGEYGTGQGREYEERLLPLYLERLTRGSQGPELEEFFRCLADLINLLALAKALRWERTEPVRWVGGGTLSRRRLQAALSKGNPGGPLELLHPPQRGPESMELRARPERLEHLLLERLTNRLRRLGREPLGVGCILLHLWECHLEARHAALRFHAQRLGEEALDRELVP